MWAFGEKILWDRAQQYIATYKPTLIGVTGSSGKTLVIKAIEKVLDKENRVRALDVSSASKKDLASAILGTHGSKRSWFRTLIGSKVGEIRAEEPDTIVVELNAEKPGDIDEVTRVLPWNMAVIVNAESINTDIFTSKGMVAHELMSLATSLPKEGIAILNIDDPDIADMATRLRCKKITFGVSSKADIQLVRADRISLKGFMGQIRIHEKTYEFSTQHLASRHQLYAILAALAVTIATQGNIQHAFNELRTLTPPVGRMNIRVGRNNSIILDDSHGATPESVKHALKTLASLPADMPGSNEISPRKIAILGDITNLGADSRKIHEEIGEMASKFCHILIAVGEEMKHAQAIALKRGGIDTHHFISSQDVGKWFSDYLKPNDIVLIKGSADMHMEKVIHSLVE